METRCLWCGRRFLWDPSMYRFCDDCVSNISEVESIIGGELDLLKLLEIRLEGKQRKKGGSHG